MLPHFAGAATPYMDPGSKGAIVGLTLAHSAEDIYFAVMEGICYEMRLNAERLADAGIPVRRLRATGGCANSRVFLQMKADVLNVPVTALRSEEAGGAGCAMLAGAALGVYPDVEQAARVLTAERETFFPRQEAHEAYSRVYERYRKLYGAVRPLMEEVQP